MSLLARSKFIVKSETKGFMGKKAFEILDPDTQKPVGTAKDVTTFFGGLLGGATIEVRDNNGDLVLSVTRSGIIFKKDQVLDGSGATVGVYKAKIFSLTSGFHIYDKDKKHVAEISGAMLKAEYKFISPAPEKAEMGVVTRSWGGLAKSLFSGGNTFGVTVAPKYAENDKAKMLMLGAVIALETIFKKKKDSGGGSSSSGGDDE